jgi:hypothetical protein
VVAEYGRKIFPSNTLRPICICEDALQVITVGLAFLESSVDMNEFVATGFNATGK